MFYFTYNSSVLVGSAFGAFWEDPEGGFIKLGLHPKYAPGAPGAPGAPRPKITFGGWYHLSDVSHASPMLHGTVKPL